MFYLVCIQNQPFLIFNTNHYHFDIIKLDVDIFTYFEECKKYHTKEGWDCVVTYACNLSIWGSRGRRTVSLRQARATQWVQGWLGVHRKALSQKSEKEREILWNTGL